MKSILFLVAHPAASADYRYRVQQFVPYLERGGYQCTIWPFSTPRLYQAMQSKKGLAVKITHMLYCTLRRLLRIADLERFDFVVIQREVFPFFTPALEKWVLQRHPRVVFSFDDAIYAGHEDVSQLSHPWLYRFKYGSGVGEIIRRCGHVIAGNRILAEYARQFHSRVSVLPTVVDCGQYRPRARQEKPDAPVTIGWIGSHSTFQYLFAIEPALRRLAAANPGRVRFTAFGFSDFQLQLPDFYPQAFRLDGMMAYLQSLDIGLMPLPDTEWTRGKCAFKAVQYMATGAATVASPVGITPDLIRHGENGLLANSGDDWYQSLQLLVDRSDLRAQMARAARRTIEQSYSLEVWGPRFVSIFDALQQQPTRSKFSHAEPIAS